ncbi:MAG: tetratricopeptide repeat protein [Methanomassiliicoccales archaeon]|nr:MAG: tetratricopeptide repeat protein [Methanomassiliicoccales archaeon]
MKEVDKLIMQAKELLNNGEFEKAAKTFDRVIKAAPDNSVGYFGKAEASIGVSKFSMVEVAQLYKKAIELEPDNPFYYKSYGDFCLDNGLLSQAEEAYNSAIKLDPEGARFYYSDLAIGYYNSGLLFPERQLNLTEEDIARKALHYSLKALDMDEKRAIDILSKR